MLLQTACHRFKQVMLTPEKELIIQEKGNIQINWRAFQFKDWHQYKSFSFCILQNHVTRSPIYVITQKTMTKALTLKLYWTWSDSALFNQWVQKKENGCLIHVVDVLSIGFETLSCAVWYELHNKHCQTDCALALWSHMEVTLKGFQFHESGWKPWLLHHEVDSSRVKFLVCLWAFAVVAAQKTDRMSEAYYFLMQFLWDWQLWYHGCLASSYLSLQNAAFESTSEHDLPLELES